MSDIILNLPITSYSVIFLRLSLACFVSFFIGYERQAHQRGAGIRTHMILCLGACGVMILSILLPAEFRDITTNGDPSRIAAQVVSGIGFLGAGAIFRFGFNVRGLTTAASIWTISGIGLMIGAGFYVLAGVSSVLLFFVLQFVDQFESSFGMKISRKEISIKLVNESNTFGDISLIVEKFATIKSQQIRYSAKDKIYTLDIIVYFPRENVKLYELSTLLEKHTNVVAFEVR